MYYLQVQNAATVKNDCNYKGSFHGKGDNNDSKSATKNTYKNDSNNTKNKKKLVNDVIDESDNCDIETSGEIHFTDPHTKNIFYTEIQFGGLSVKLGDCLRANLEYEKGAQFTDGICQVLEPLSSLFFIFRVISSECYLCDFVIYFSVYLSYVLTEITIVTITSIITTITIITSDITISTISTYM